MAVTKYYTIEGTIIAEDQVGGTGLRTYGADALGSVCDTYDSTGMLQDTFRYSPYGRSIVSTGSVSAPAYLWVGSLGYRNNAREFFEYYVRQRTYSSSLARWSSVDPLWPREVAYAYAKNGPVSKTDSSGLYTVKTAPVGAGGCCCPTPGGVSSSHYSPGNDPIGVAVALGGDYAWGWNLKFPVTLKYTPVAANFSGDWQCAVEWTEKMNWNNGSTPLVQTGSKDPTFGNYTAGASWNQCIQSSGANPCNVVDSPGFDPLSKGITDDSSLRYFFISISVQFRGGLDCKCSATQPATFTGLLMWFDYDYIGGAPDIWSP